MSVESLEPIQLQNSWNSLAHGEITECSGQFPQWKDTVLNVAKVLSDGQMFPHEIPDDAV